MWANDKSKIDKNSFYIQQNRYINREKKQYSFFGTNFYRVTLNKDEWVQFYDG